jgi:hypothetical protein
VRSLLAICILAYAGSVQACDWWVASVASHHYGPGSHKDYEQRNWGLGCEVKLTKTVDFVAGFYRNSIRIDSEYVGFVWAPLTYGAFRFGTAATLVSGYEKEPVKALIPVVALEGRHLGANLLIVPPTKANTGAIGLQLKVRFQ